jgi:DNA-binding MurR/RpiR family transcriptional regulator
VIVSLHGNGGFMVIKIKDIVEEIMVRNYDKLTVSEKKIARYILDHLEEAAFLTSTKLARKVGVSEATVVRFATELGYSGFPKLQETLQNCVKEKIKPSEKLERYATGNKNIYDKIFTSIIQNLKDTRENIRFDLLDQITGKIIAANKIYIVGFRRSFSVAYVLYYNLVGLSMNALLVDSNYGLLFDKVIGMNKKDVCVSICFPRYAALTYEIIKYAKKIGCPTIVITDSLVSPIAQLADYPLVSKYEISSYFDSNIIAMAIADCIVAGIARKRKKSIKFLTRFEKKLQDFSTWVISE